MHSIDDLKNNPDIISLAEENIQSLQASFIDILLSTDSKFTDPDIDDKINSVFQNWINIFNNIPLMVTYLHKNIARGRPNIPNRLFNHQQEISYNKAMPDVVPFGRFNQFKEALFYGSLPTESKSVDFVLNCCLECCKELTDDLCKLRYKDITVGIWNAKGEMPAFNFCFDEIHLKENPSLKSQVEQYLSQLKECYSLPVVDLIKKIMFYVSKLSGTMASSDFHYFATTALFHAIRWCHRDRLNNDKVAIIYPSAMSEKKGMNIVLTQNLVASDLKLNKVVIYRYFLGQPRNQNVVGYPCSHIVNVDGEVFEITGYIQPN